MEFFADAIVFSLWSLFFAATAMGGVVEYRRSHGSPRKSIQSPLKDKDPVYLIEPQLHDHAA